MIRIKANEIADLKAMMEALTIIRPTGEVEICRDYSAVVDNAPLVVEWRGNGGRKQGMGISQVENGNRIPVVYDPESGAVRRQFSALVVK